MKPYGIPRCLDVEHPDLVDIQVYGLKSSRSRCRTKSGDRKNSIRSTSRKARIRRLWKKRERQEAKRALSNIEE